MYDNNSNPTHIQNSTTKIPERFICPLTQQIYYDPRIVETKAYDEKKKKIIVYRHVFERIAILRRLSNHNTNPLNGCRITTHPRYFKKDEELCKEINAFLEENSDCKPKRYDPWLSALKENNNDKAEALLFLFKIHPRCACQILNTFSQDVVDKLICKRSKGRGSVLTRITRVGSDIIVGTNNLRWMLQVVLTKASDDALAMASFAVDGDDKDSFTSYLEEYDFPSLLRTGIYPHYRAIIHEEYLSKLSSSTNGQRVIDNYWKKWLTAALKQSHKGETELIQYAFVYLLRYLVDNYKRTDIQATISKELLNAEKEIGEVLNNFTMMPDSEADVELFLSFVSELQIYNGLLVDSGSDGGDVFGSLFANGPVSHVPIYLKHLSQEYAANIICHRLDSDSFSNLEMAVEYKSEYFSDLLNVLTEEQLIDAINHITIYDGSEINIFKLMEDHDSTSCRDDLLHRLSVVGLIYAYKHVPISVKRELDQRVTNDAVAKSILQVRADGENGLSIACSVAPKLVPVLLGRLTNKQANQALVSDSYFKQLQHKFSGCELFLSEMEPRKELASMLLNPLDATDARVWRQACRFAPGIVPFLLKRVTDQQLYKSIFSTNDAKQCAFYIASLNSPVVLPLLLQHLSDVQVDDGLLMICKETMLLLEIAKSQPELLNLFFFAKFNDEHFNAVKLKLNQCINDNDELIKSLYKTVDIIQLDKKSKQDMLNSLKRQRDVGKKAEDLPENEKEASKKSKKTEGNNLRFFGDKSNTESRGEDDTSASYADESYNKKSRR